MTSEELVLAVNGLIRRITMRIESGQIVPTDAYRSHDAALRAIEDAIVELVHAHTKIQNAVRESRPDSR